MSAHEGAIPETPAHAFRYRFLRPAPGERRGLAAAHLLSRLVDRLDPPEQGATSTGVEGATGQATTGPDSDVPTANNPETEFREPTIVEITFHDPGLPPAETDAEILHEPSADLLMIAIEGLQDLLDAYRIVAYVPIRSARYMSMGGFMVTVEVEQQTRTRTPALWFPIEALQKDLADRWRPQRATERIVEASAQWAARLHIGDPTTVYGVQIWEARRACWVDANYEAAVLHAAIAAESMLSSLWLTLRWESGEDAAVSVARLSKNNRNFFSWIFGQLSQDLKGNWHIGSVPELQNWSNHTRELRNTIAHLGIRCTRPEADAALDAVYQLQRFIRSKLISQIDRFPRTNYLVAGSEGVDCALGPGTWKRRACSLIPEDTWYKSFAEWVTDGRDSTNARFTPVGVIDQCRDGCPGHDEDLPADR